MSSKRTNPDLVNLSTIDSLVVPPPKEYTFFEDAEKHLFEASVSSYSIINAWWMAEFATLSYANKKEVEKEINKLKDRISIKKFDWLKKSETNSEGFVVQFESYTVVSFRGTQLVRPSEILDMTKNNDFLQDVITDADFRGAKLEGVNVHKGILTALNSMWGQLEPILEESTKPVWFTGHSLGGALAILAAFKWKGSSNIGGVYTIGCPAIGSSEFKEKYNKELLNNTFHHIYGEDLITNIGPIVENTPGVLGFQQVGKIKNLPRVDINFFENLTWLLLMPLIDHGPIFYMNSLWNKMVR